MLRYFSLLLLCLLFSEIWHAPHAELKAQSKSKFPEIYKVSCLRQRQGCPCYASPEKKKIKSWLFHAEAARSTGKRQGSLIELSLENRQCWYPLKTLEQMKYNKVLRSRFQELDHSPLPLEKLLPKIVKPKARKKVRLGFFWPTYYHLALEDFHSDGPQRAIRARGQSILGYASKSFLEQVRWQGSGISKSGLRLHIISNSRSNSLRFESYPNSIWGWGAGSGRQVFPYRTIALHFPGLCKALKIKGQHCRKSTVIGTLLHIKEVAEANIPIPGPRESKHDGYFCANDTGSPYYIRKDRIDIFVGTHGGGNPYLPLARQGNALRKGGIENLVPSDWRIWQSSTERLWCPEHKIPAKPHQPRKGDCTHDYHVVAAHKALQIYAFLKPDGSPLRCRI